MLINDEKEIKIIKINPNSLHEINNNIKVSSSFINIHNNYINKKEIQEHNDFDNNKILYLNNKRYLCYKKEYNQKIISLYNNGILNINNLKTNLKDYYIIYNTNDKIYHLINVNNDSIKDISYNKAVKFIDTTAFTELIKTSNMNTLDNTITIDYEALMKIISNWNGKLHNKIWYTEAINNNILEEDI